MQTAADPQALDVDEGSPNDEDPRRSRGFDSSTTQISKAARAKRQMPGFAKAAATSAVLGAAAVSALIIWDYYVLDPWTRDGRIRVQVASIAPQVAGQITQLRVVDNQFVRKGDILYVIDRFDYQNALDQARAQVRLAAADFQVRSVEAERRRHLTALSTTPEQQQEYAGNATQAEARFNAAQVLQAKAEINLDRTIVTSPVNGFVTNFQMRLGDYAREGIANLSIIDADSYWVDGYFEETKMARLCLGDRAEIYLMGYRTPITGLIETITRGIAVSDATPSIQGLPSVNPVYTWVRLAQRVPVRIRITSVPPGVPLVSGMTASVYIAPKQTWAEASLPQRLSMLAKHLVDPFMDHAARPGCIPARGSNNGGVASLPVPEPSRPLSASEINPGLESRMGWAPR